MMERVKRAVAFRHNAAACKDSGLHFQGRDVTVSISACDADCAGANPVGHPNSNMKFGCSVALN
jgi:hypothetical protein